MKAGIITDTHENLEHIGKAVDFFNEMNVDTVFHAGDIISPITFLQFRNLKAPFTGVFGNNDGERFFLQAKFAAIGQIFEDCYEASLDGMKLFMYHKPICLPAIAASGFYDIIIYGHTHEIDIRIGGKSIKPDSTEEIQKFICEQSPIIINPGECCAMLTGRSSAVVFDTETRALYFKYLYLNKDFKRPVF